MSDLADRPADQVFVARIEQPTDPRRRRLVWVAGLVRVAAAGLGFVDDPTSTDIVVRRRDDDEEVLRVAASGAEEAAIQLDYVETQLRTLTDEEFLEAWEPVETD